MDFHLLGLVFIIMHEMDAVRCKEWRIFPGLSLLNDKVGSALFLILHLPLFYWVLNEILLENESFRIGFDYFLIIHLFLHVLFLLHKRNEFKDWISWSIIIGAALSGLVDILTP